MKEYREVKSGNEVTIWDDENGIGLRFTIGNGMQFYNSDIVLKDNTILQTEKGIERVGIVEMELTEYASARYPKDFETLKF
jgi:hypothetical protein